MDLIVWIQFLLTISILMFIARKSLWVALAFSALVLGSISIEFLDLSVIVTDTLSDPSIILLAISVGLIAVIGGALEMTGLIDDLMSNTSLKRRPAMIVIPAMLGMLPIPGGALLSSPVVKRGAGRTDDATKASINVWSRHIAVLFYPLGSLLACTKMAGLDLYEILIYMVPGLVLTIVLTWIFLIRRLENGRMNEGKRDRKKALVPVLLILSAPAVHASMMNIFPQVIEEVFLLIGVSLSLILILIVKRRSLRYLIPVTKRMKAWNFVLIIMAMFIFLEIFNASDAPGAISTLPFSRAVLVVIAGGLLGVVTGRVNVPISIMLPILSTAAFPQINNVTFTILFFSIFIGFLISPVHPCVSVSLEYFKTDYLSVLKRTIIPAVIAWVISMGASLLLV